MCTLLQPASTGKLIQPKPSTSTYKLYMVLISANRTSSDHIKSIRWRVWKEWRKPPSRPLCLLYVAATLSPGTLSYLRHIKHFDEQKERERACAHAHWRVFTEELYKGGLERHCQVKSALMGCWQVLLAEDQHSVSGHVAPPACERVSVCLCVSV